MAAILIEPTVIEHRTDPAILAGTTTSLGSYCLRWQLVLSGQSRTVAVNRRQVPVR